MKQLKAMAEALANMPSANISFGGGASGNAGVNGTAHYEGTANVRGNWGVREGGRSLVGELGQEIVVRNGRFFTVGDNGAEFVDLQRGDIVFNHVQTKSLLKNGYVAGRGKAYANGAILQPANLGYDVDALVQSLKNNMDYIINPLSSIDKNVDTIMRTTNNISNVNNNRTNSFSVGDITVHCTGITSDAVAKEVGSALKKELFGMTNYANQRTSVTR